LTLYSTGSLALVSGPVFTTSSVSGQELRVGYESLAPGEISIIQFSGRLVDSITTGATIMNTVSGLRTSLASSTLTG
jgi:hypothetical protein